MAHSCTVFPSKELSCNQTSHILPAMRFCRYWLTVYLTGVFHRHNCVAHCSVESNTIKVDGVGAMEAIGIVKHPYTLAHNRFLLTGYRKDFMGFMFLEQPFRRHTCIFASYPCAMYTLHLCAWIMSS